ncbi:MAG: hypothetical protein MUC85_05400 [Anaerolineales bacterium]|jgi:nitrogen regulatory protein PII|nr:hypothetical protein [Anaerolineales bacterium]
MYMILLVIDDPHKLDQVLAAWEQTGIKGATIIESTGIQRLRRKSIPMRYLFQTSALIEEGHLTLLVIVENEQMVQACLHATEQIVGDLNTPHTGVFAAWPLTIVRGVPPAKGEG